MNTEETKVEEKINEEAPKEEKVEEKEKEPQNNSEPKNDKKVKKDALEKLNLEIKNLKEENAKMKDDYLRARAEMENTKRRLSDEAVQNRKYASMNLVENMINPVDMLLKATAMETESPELKNYLIGFKMIAGQLVDVLKADGLAEIEIKDNEFDPKFQHAVEKEHVEGVEPNKVIKVLQTGYKYKDRVLRPAMVKVSE